MNDPVLNELGMTELLLAAYHGELDWVQNCIRGGLNVAARDNGGMTPLHWVVDMGMVGSSEERGEVARLLISSGADIDAIDLAGRSVLAVAVLAGNHKLVQLLVDVGADVNLADKHGRKPLDVALSNESRTIINVLRKAGAIEQKS